MSYLHSRYNETDTPAEVAELAAVMSRPDVREAQFDTLFDRSPVGVAFVSSSGLFLRVNEAFSRIVGYGAAELENRVRFQDITVSSDVGPDEKMAKEVVDGKRDSYFLKKSYLTKQRTIAEVDLDVFPIRDKDGGFVHLCGFARPACLSAEHMRPVVGPDGTVTYRAASPSPGSLLRDWGINPKWILGILSGISMATLGSAGAVINTYFQNAAEIKYIRANLEESKAELDLARAERKEVKDQLARQESLTKAADAKAEEARKRLEEQLKAVGRKVDTLKE